MTHTLTAVEATARCEASRNIVELCDTLDPHTYAEIVSGRAQAYIVAASQVYGWPETMKVIEGLRAATNIINHPVGSA